MSKIKKITITAVAITLLSSGITYSLCKNKSKEFESYMKIYQVSDDDLLICAHRGFSSMEVENTTKAISLASEKDYVDIIEFDLRLSKDNIIIVSHDNSIIDENNKSVIISETNSDELLNKNYIYQRNAENNYFWYDSEILLINNRNKKLNNQNYQLITLDEAIKKANNKKIILDLKIVNDAELFVTELKKELNNIDTSNIIIQSFSIPVLKYLKDNTNYNCQLLVSNEGFFDYIDEFDNIGLRFDLVNYNLIKKLIDNNKTVAIWTINSTNELNSVLDNVQEYYKDIIYITDYPDLILTRLNKKKLIKQNI